MSKNASESIRGEKKYSLKILQKMHHRARDNRLKTVTCKEITIFLKNTFTNVTRR